MPLTDFREGLYARRCCPWKTVENRKWRRRPKTSLYLVKQLENIASAENDELPKHAFYIKSLPSGGCVSEVYPPEVWSPSHNLISLPNLNMASFGVEQRVVLHIQIPRKDMDIYAILWARALYSDYWPRVQHFSPIWADYRIVPSASHKLAEGGYSWQDLILLSRHELLRMPRYADLDRAVKIRLSITSQAACGMKLLVIDVRELRGILRTEVLTARAVVETWFHRISQRLADHHPNLYAVANGLWRLGQFWQFTTILLRAFFPLFCVLYTSFAYESFTRLVRRIFPYSIIHVASAISRLLKLGHRIQDFGALLWHSDLIYGTLFIAILDFSGDFPVHFAAERILSKDNIMALAPWIGLILYGYSISTWFEFLLHIRGALLWKFADDEIAEHAL